MRECEFFPDDLPRVTDIGYPTDALPRVTAGTNQAWEGDLRPDLCVSQPHVLESTPWEFSAIFLEQDWP